MESKSIYPESFRVALEQKADSKKFDELFGSSDYLPVFVYGSLILPSVIDRVTQQDDVKKMVVRMLPARLEKHQRYSVEVADYPAILPTKNAKQVVDGMLVFGLNSEERGCLDRLESNLYTLEKVQVHAALSDGESRLVDAEVYTWGGDRDELEENEDKPWSISS